MATISSIVVLAITNHGVVEKEDDSTHRSVFICQLLFGENTVCCSFR